jgi:hypothetical protein
MAMANQPMHHSSSLPGAIVMMVMDSLETENINTLLTCRAIFPNFPRQINNPLELTPQLGLEIVIEKRGLEIMLLFKRACQTFHTQCDHVHGHMVHHVHGHMVHKW